MCYLILRVNCSRQNIVNNGQQSGVQVYCSRAVCSRNSSTVHLKFIFDLVCLWTFLPVFHIQSRLKCKSWPTVQRDLQFMSNTSILISVLERCFDFYCYMIMRFPSNHHCVFEAAAWYWRFVTLSKVHGYQGTSLLGRGLHGPKF
jgi:hypothetical protein